MNQKQASATTPNSEGMTKEVRTPQASKRTRTADDETVRAGGGVDEKLVGTSEAKAMRMEAWEADSVMGALGLGESRGVPLPAAQQAQFEGSLGTDLSAVRVHTGEASAQAAQNLGAKAFATGNDIHFAAGQFRPEEASGAHLLAHEVAHTVQQRSGTALAQTKLETTSPEDAMEQEADEVADQMLAGQPTTVGRSAAQVIARQAEGQMVTTATGVASGGAVAATAAQLFAMGGEHSWPTVLPQSTVRRGALGIRDGSRVRGVNVAPTLTVPRSRTPATELNDDQEAALRRVIEAIRARMSGIEIPAANGELIIHNGGYAYRAVTHAAGSAAAAAHDAYMDQANPLGLTVTPPPRALAEL